MLLLTIILVWVIPGLTLPTSTPPERKAVNPVAIIPINNVTGTIIEATDRISIKSAKWTLIAFFDLSQLAREIETVKQGIQSIKKWCPTAYEVCPTIIQTLQQEVAKIQDADQLMHHQRYRECGQPHVNFGYHHQHYEEDDDRNSEEDAGLRSQSGQNQGRRLPITSETTRDVYRLATTRVQETEDLLIFHTSIPLVEEDEFTVYRMEPIPQITREGLVITKTETRYLAIDDHRKHHFAISLEHLQQCISGTNGNKVCEFKQTLFGPDAHQLSCTMAALSRHRIGECKPEPIKGTNYWVQLTEQNAWIFGTTKPITMTYVCSAEKDQIIIEGVGKLTIRPDCVSIQLIRNSKDVRELCSRKTTEGQLESTLDQLDRLHAEVQGLKTWTKQTQEDVDNEAGWNLAHQYSGVIMLGVAILVAAWAGCARGVRTPQQLHEGGGDGRNSTRIRSRSSIPREAGVPPRGMMRPSYQKLTSEPEAATIFVHKLQYTGVPIMTGPLCTTVVRTNNLKEEQRHDQKTY
ncbi:uncharacterized protein LOC123257556 [Drosophila ananassae]|uniref:uncharacterized protein LOC123257556 n=1 Tax=Drosophila ananassae TaxID=7217 RepID=UPI001D001833|nr:uncharacterized protein LOC123257556 [Drosophila ananassae]